MGCCQVGTLENEVVLDKGALDMIQPIKPMYFVPAPSEPEVKCEPTPSFGSVSKKFTFDPPIQPLEIN